MNEKEFIAFMDDAFNTEQGLIFGDFKTMYKILTEEGYIIIKKEEAKSK